MSKPSINPDTAQISGLLLLLGFQLRDVFTRNSTDRKRLGKRFFDRHTELELHEWLERAHNQYRSRMKQIHPDRNPHRLHEAAELNRVWRRIKYLFKLRGIE